MGNSTGDDKNFAGIYCAGFTIIEVEADGALEDEGDLLIVMGMGWDDAAFGEDDAREHGLTASDELALKERIELFAFYIGPTIEGRGGHWRLAFQTEVEAEYEFLALCCASPCVD